MGGHSGRTDSSITFEGTSNSDLEVLDNPAYEDGNIMRSMDELIRQTKSFNEIYKHPSEDDFPDGNNDGTGPTPKIVLIQGSEIDEETTTLSTNKG